MYVPLAASDPLRLPFCSSFPVGLPDCGHVVVEVLEQRQFVGAPLLSGRPGGAVSAGLMRFLVREVVVNGLLKRGHSFVLPAYPSRRQVKIILGKGIAILDLASTRMRN